MLLSGGMDSCVTAAIASQTHGLALLHASYGQRTEQRERRAFEEIAEFFGARERLTVRFDAFKQIGGSALTDQRIAVPESGESLAPGSRIPVTYVPFRNAHFLSAAVSWAEVIGASAIYIGAVAEDSSGYPDCRPEYYRAFEALIREGTRPETRIEIITPVIAYAKERNRSPRPMNLARHWSEPGLAINRMTKLAGRAIVAASAGAHSTRRGCATLSPIGRKLRDNDL